MIKTIIPVKIEVRGIATSIVQLEIVSYKGTPEGNFYTVHDYAISETESGVVKRLIQEKTVFYDSGKINALNNLLESQNDYSQLTKMERDWAKIVDGLLYDTQTNLFEDGATVYEIQPNQWVKC
ncbi:hypothetical protein [Flavobacterium sp. 3-210]